ncbi:MAG TPA: hypothetical protein VL096_05455 [Pirellulaceae bacterium]|nr:hypothetical protein [Pirellulaceae bacterium]
MKTILKFVALTSLLAGLGLVFTPNTAQAQYPVVVAGYAPAVTYYRPRPILRPFTYTAAVTAVPAVAAVPTTAYYAPTTSYYAPTTTYYAPTAYAAPTTTYYAPATTSYYAPARTTYYAPTTTYYAPARTTYYAPTIVAPPVVVPAW